MRPDAAPAVATGSRPLHIGLYSPAWPPGDSANGIVTYVRVVRDEFRRLGHRVSVFGGACETTTADGVFRIEDAPRGSRWAAVCRRLGLGASPLYSFGSRIAATVLRRHAVDPLDVFEMEESFGWCDQVAARLPVPTVVKLHGPAFLSLMDSDAEGSELQRRMRSEGRALRAARWIVAPSRTTLQATASRYALKAGPLVQIPNPIPAVADALIWRSEPALTNEILFVGRFDYRKGADAMLQAFARVVLARPGARLTFVGPDAGLAEGGGPRQHYAEYVRDRLTPDVASRVRFLGKRPAQEVQQLRLQAGVTVAATRWESFGYVVAEAMSQGCPVVGFDVDGVNELITSGESGLLVAAGDVDALASAILRVLDDPMLAQRLGAQARAAVASICGVEHVALQMLALYRKALDRPAAHGGRG